jgi:hypothetical protein
MSPWQAAQAAAAPDLAWLGRDNQLASAVSYSLVAAVAAAIGLNAIGILMVRTWNPSREARPQSPDEHPTDSAAREVNVHSAGGKVRHVWDNPILWREVCTWAYGRKIVAVRLAYIVIFLVCTAALMAAVTGSDARLTNRSIVSTEVKPLAPLLVVSLILLNALAVTSLTNERDVRALDLLLVTDLSPREIIFGKLFGAFYNAKEMLLAPLALAVYLWWIGRLTNENFVFLITGLLTMYAFAAMLGLHAGMTFVNGRTAIAISIGTLIFLFLGVATCMRIMLAFQSSFQNQMLSFLGIVGGGGVALFAVLGLRNRSAAMWLAFVPLPFCTFFAITSFLMGQFGLVFFVTVATYGFATLAMLKPALAEFDIVTGRTVAYEGG